MSGQETEQLLEEEDGEFKTYSEVAERIAAKTLPGDGNEALVNSVGEASDVMDDVVSDLNNWVEVIDARIFRGKVLGMPCRYRWTIKRWADSDMDKWLIDNGWEKLPHLMADSRQHEDNEMEARYYKKFGEWDVFVNIYVEFTEDVFEALSENSSKIPGIGPDDVEETDDHLEAMKRMRRSE